MKAMHNRHKLTKAMDKFREGLTEMQCVDPDNPESPGVKAAVEHLEGKLDFWLEEVDKVPAARFTPAPWEYEGGDVIATSETGLVVLIASGVEPCNADILTAAPDLVYASYGLWRRLEADPSLKEGVLDDIAAALRKAGICVV
jgi:hypothetical protein